MNKFCEGKFITIDGEAFYKIENYDLMDDFFMTITSSSDVWNFCWSKGGVTAGRINSDNAIFPYYTADKVSDDKSYTGPYTLIEVNKSGVLIYWEPFSKFRNSPSICKKDICKLQYNIYKNTEGSCVWFEEVNNELKLSFRYCWTSSAKFGLVRKAVITNLDNSEVSLRILDGCQNILPACISSDFQNNNSVLLDAYKKTDLDSETKLSLFSLSSVVSDKAEPCEALYANTCWFSTDDKVFFDSDAPKDFFENKCNELQTLKGKRSSCFIEKKITLDSKHTSNSWYQIFDTPLDACRIESLKKIISNKTEATKLLENDILKTNKTLLSYVSEADGVQNTADKMTCLHHFANVMFNIMRGGLIADNGKIHLQDFASFTEERNKKESENIRALIKNNFPSEENVEYNKLYIVVRKTENCQIERLFLEYMPLTFSRRHGDPSRPWNRFNINLQDSNGNPMLNYEGNWRDIFQNWEALTYSYPQYIKNMCAKFVNAMTIDGFNPYKISRNGIDWEVPDSNNPWAQIGYWGDHQVIYLEKLLESYSNINKNELISFLNEPLFTSSNVPFRIKSYKDILSNPRNTIVFDKELSATLLTNSKVYGTDAKLVLDKNINPSLVTLTTKLLQIVISKSANLVPGGGIWLNTQRPEWNDANNALAGYGLSMVTVYYLVRYINNLISLYSDSSEENFIMPKEVANCFVSLGNLFINCKVDEVCTDNKLRFDFVKKAGIIFEKERNSLYSRGYSNKNIPVDKNEIIKYLNAIKKLLDKTISLNKRDDGLYHSYNTLKVEDRSMQIENLQEMLEGQVAVLSSGTLKPEESLSVFKALKSSRMFEPRQYCYMLYPNKELPFFTDKNCVSKDDVKCILNLINRTHDKILALDCKGVYHFNPEFKNSRFMKEYISTLSKEEQPNEEESKCLFDLYEKTFSHQCFTGRSGTFYAYEGLGSIYWHMVSKLLLAAQENVFKAYNLFLQNKTSLETAQDLAEVYYDIRKGIGFNKEPELYGAFPSDPYSHTPYGQGAKQPGMTGQVKEEILTRWGELGVSIKNGKACFIPILLKKNEFNKEGLLSFTWCGTPVTYHLSDNSRICISNSNDEITREELYLTEEELLKIFKRSHEITSIDVFTNLEEALI